MSEKNHGISNVTEVDGDDPPQVLQMEEEKPVFEMRTPEIVQNSTIDVSTYSAAVYQLLGYSQL